MTGPGGPGAGPQGPVSDDELVGCEDEPIHIPGAVQPHGVLLGVDAAGVVRAASANTTVLGVPPLVVVDRPLDQVIGPAAAAAVAALVDAEPAELRLDRPGLVDVVVHRGRGGDLDLVELEPPSDVDLEGHLPLAAALSAVQEAGDVPTLLERTVAAVQRLTGFDRVMAYRFDEAWNGEVVAERAAPGLEPFLGLRYPASDIPPQARALYLRNRLRLIPDATAVPVPLVTSGALGGAPVDLTDATLRAVSPVHLTYLRNMGVAASMSVALVHGGRLWGLVACHHYAGPRRPSPRVRAAVTALVGTTSAVLGGLEAAASAVARLELGARLDALTQRMAGAGRDGPGAALADDEGLLLGLVGANGAAVRTERGVQLVGVAPPAPAVEALFDQLDRAGRRELVTAHLGAERLPPELAAAGHAGVLAVPAGASGEWLAWFRPERLETVRWGGDPAEKPVERDAAGVARLGPRRSFAEYAELVRGRCEPWMAEQVDVARELGRRLGEAVAREARRDHELAAALQRAVLLERLPALPGVDLGVRYVPAASAALGGDWYDVFFLPDGRAVIALGDVAGHGMAVAATMAQLRHALRAYVVREAGPAEAMLGLNELVRALLPDELATGVVVVVEPGTGSLELVSAGHLPPVLVQQHGAALVPVPRNPALGLPRVQPYEALRLALQPGDALVLCTDGLVEERRVPLDIALDRLVEAAGALWGRTGEEVCDGLVAALRPGEAADDLTVLALRLAPT